MGLNSQNDDIVLDREKCEARKQYASAASEDVERKVRCPSCLCSWMSELREYGVILLTIVFIITLHTQHEVGKEYDQE